MEWRSEPKNKVIEQFVFNVMSRVRGHHTCTPLHFILQWARTSAYKGASGSRYQSIYEPTEPSQPIMSDDVNDQIDHNTGNNVPYLPE